MIGGQIPGTEEAARSQVTSDPVRWTVETPWVRLVETQKKGIGVSSISSSPKQWPSVLVNTRSEYKAVRDKAKSENRRLLKAMASERTVDPWSHSSAKTAATMAPMLVPPTAS